MSSDTSPSISSEQRMPRMSQGAFIGIIALAVSGGGGWAYLQAQVNQQDRQIAEQDRRMALIEAKLDELSRGVSRIEGYMRAQEGKR